MIPDELPEPSTVAAAVAIPATSRRWLYTKPKKFKILKNSRHYLRTTAFSTMCQPVLNIMARSLAA
jgi:hypothetical protein